MGGTDWSGLDFAIEYVGVTDVEGLVTRLMVIRSHKPIDMKVNQGGTDDEQS